MLCSLGVKPVGIQELEFWLGFGQGSAAEDESKGIGVSFQHILDFSLFPWHTGIQMFSCWEGKFPFLHLSQSFHKLEMNQGIPGGCWGWEGAQISQGWLQLLPPAACGNLNFHGIPAQAFPAQLAFFWYPSDVQINSLPN